MSRYLNSFVYAMLGIGGLCAVIGAVGHAGGYLINTTDSEPVGIWQRVGGPTTVERGDVVQVCLPPHKPQVEALRAFGYFIGQGCPDGMPRLVKPAAALPGDTVRVAAQGITVNGKLLPNTKQLTQDGAHDALPRVPFGRYVVPKGKVWLVSTYNPISLDSRYFGAVPMSGIQAVIQPVLVRQ